MPAIGRRRPTKGRRSRTPAPSFSAHVEERIDIATDMFTSSASVKKPAEVHHGSDLITWPAVLTLGVFLLLMFHAPRFRRAVFAALGHLWRAVRGLLWDWPRAVWRSRSLRALRLSGPARFLHRHFFSPLLITLLVVGTMFVVGVSARFLVWWGWALFAALAAFYNTRFGWVFQDRVAEALSDWWRAVRTNLIPGLIATILDWFRTLANWVERQLYAVERGGCGSAAATRKTSFVLKAALGLVWFPIAYLTRFAFYLLIEPQVNPVKHFPVVTVGHKVVWPMLPQLAGLIGAGPAVVVINGCPGIFGFVAWELKEN